MERGELAATNAKDGFEALREPPGSIQRSSATGKSEVSQIHVSRSLRRSCSKFA